VLFSGNAVVRKLIEALRKHPEATGIVEAALDDLFQDLRRDREFEHTEVVMAFLFALKQAEWPSFRDIAGPLADSRAAEIGRLGRYARMILA
jgi:hypothetical protein